MTEETTQQAKSRAEVTNDTLESVKGKFDEVIIVGIKDGVIDVAPSLPTYQFAQWMLSRAIFELNISEKAGQVTQSA